MIILLAAVAQGAGCAGRTAHVAGPEAKGPNISSIKVAVAALTPVMEQEREASADFVMLEVKVKNPERVGASGKIACLRDQQLDRELDSRPLLHRFDVDPEQLAQYKVPVDVQEPAAYVLRCRLEFNDEIGAPHRTPSPWVKVQVPSRG